MKLAAAIIALSLLVPSAALAGVPPSLELRSAAPCSPTTPSFALPQGGRTLCFSPYVIATRTNMTKLAVSHARDGLQVIDIELDAQSAGALAEITSAQPPGRNMMSFGPGNIIGLFADGTLVAAPVVMEPLRGGKLEISGENMSDLAGKLGIAP
jgi:preprotein translocase subunit SecD